MRVVAHETGHVLCGSGHTDYEVGAVPLPGTNRLERLMYSDLEAKKHAGLLNTNRLVKKEWDAAEVWLKSRPNGDS